MGEADYLISVAQYALWILALASAPILLPTLMVGVIVGMLQAATSINEATLGFVVKLVVVAISLALFGSAIMGLLSDFTIEMYDRIPDLVR